MITRISCDHARDVLASYYSGNTLTSKLTQFDRGTEISIGDTEIPTATLSKGSSHAIYWKRTMADETMWTYRGIDVYRAAINGSGIRWYTRMPSGDILKADTKEGMRELIRHYLAHSR